MSEHEELLAELRALRGYVTELEESGMELIPLDIAEPPPEMAESVVVPIAAESEPVYAPAPVTEPEGLDSIRLEMGECHRCQLGDGRTNLVFGVGNPRARVVFVGEAPGHDEDLQGEPFVGEAGQILNRVITRMGLDRQEVYICNVIKCRPPGNRNPQPTEIEQCQPFLLRQLRAIAPEAIVALGTFAAQTLLNTKEPISKLRGSFHDYCGIPLMPTFHPSYLLHNRKNTDLFWLVWDDMVQVLKKLGLPVPDVQRKGR